MNSEYAQNASRENSIEQRKSMEELKRMNQPNSAPQPQSIQPIVIQCDLPQAMNKMAEQADGINWELEEIKKNWMNTPREKNRKNNSMSKRWEDCNETGLGNLS